MGKIANIINEWEPIVFSRWHLNLLPVDAKLAETELEKISQCYGKTLGTTAFNAEMTLKEWRKGNIKFDY